MESAPSAAAARALASLSAAAGVIHLVMVPSHWTESGLEGLGFAVAGWFQLVWAGVVLRRSSRWILGVAVAVNAALIAVWVVSRTEGLPFGAHAGHPETASFVDVTTVGLELALVVAIAVVVGSPRLGARGGFGRVGLGVIAPAAALVLATAAIASPSVRDHAAGSHGEHAAGAPGEAIAGGHSHAAEAEAADDKGLSLLHNGQHAHIGLSELDADTQAALDAQLAVTRDVSEQYPTVAAILAAGYTRVGPFLPGIGAHYMRDFTTAMNPDGVIDDQDLRNPLMVIYEGTEPDSRVAGFMFYSTAPTDPVGFAGSNDVWHYHESLCLKYGNGVIDVPYGLDHEATPEQCAQAGGWVLPISQWMVHVWSVPGYEMTDEGGGVFGEVNPALTCPDGTYYTMPVEQWSAHPLNACRSELA